MAEGAPPDVSYEIVCPHCSRAFQGQLIGGSALRYRGFKCPHCRLFVPYERVEQELTPSA